MTIANKYDEILSPMKSRVYKFLEYKGIRKRIFFEKTEISSSNFRGKSAKSELGGDKIAKILAEYPELSTQWVITGVGEMIKTDLWRSLSLKGGSTDESGVLSPLTKMDTTNVPLVNRHAYSNFIKEYEKNKSSKLISRISWNIEEFEFTNDLLAFEHIGDSMDNGSRLGIMDGDFLLGSCVPRKNWLQEIKGQNFAIFHKQKGILVKQVFVDSKDENNLKCLSKNKIYEDVEININDIIDLYKIIKLKRDFRY